MRYKVRVRVGAVVAGLFQTKVGGITYSWLSPNAYIRASKIAEDRIISPNGEPIADVEDRPLPYFIAHGATHLMQARTFGRLFGLRYPDWLNEGYADYVEKGGDFDFDENLSLLRADSPVVGYVRSGRYLKTPNCSAFVPSNGHFPTDRLIGPGCEGRSVRIHRSVLQPQSSAFAARLRFSGAIPSGRDQGSANQGCGCIIRDRWKAKSRGTLTSNMNWMTM